MVTLATLSGPARPRTTPDSRSTCRALGGAPSCSARFLPQLAEPAARERSHRVALRAGVHRGVREPVLPAGRPEQVIDPRRVAIDVLSNANELDDTVGPYGKSLLYLVSRALEPAHKTPILGMEAAWNPRLDKEGIFRAPAPGKPNPDVAFWRKTWLAISGGAAVLEEQRVIEELPAFSVRSVHGCFDNWIEWRRADARADSRAVGARDAARADPVAPGLQAPGRVVRSCGAGAGGGRRADARRPMERWRRGGRAGRASPPGDVEPPERVTRRWRSFAAVRRRRRGPASLGRKGGPAGADRRPDLPRPRPRARRTTAFVPLPELLALGEPVQPAIDPAR